MTDRTQTSPVSREQRKNRFIGLTALFMVLYGASVSADLLLDVNLFWLTAALMIIAIGFAFLWARALDEAQMQAHYVSWYWGGSLGLMASALVFIALMPVIVAPGAVDALFLRELGPMLPNLSFTAGFLLGMTPAVIGYLIWWGVITLQRR